MFRSADMNVGNKLRFIRETKKITIYKLSKDTGISQNHISSIELGKRQPTIETLSRLIEPLGISLAELFNDDTEVMFPTQEERRLVENYRCLPKDKADALLNLSDLLQR